MLTLLVPVAMRPFLTHKKTTTNTDESLTSWEVIQSSSLGDDEGPVGLVEEFLIG